MLTYSLRVLRIGLAQKRLPKTGPFDPIVQKFRAWPWYCDQNLHVNNAHYLTFMDYGRVAWLVRCGFIKLVTDGDHTAVVVGVGMTYRRELRWFSAFELETRVVGVEGRWCYVAQTFRQGGKVAARGVLRIGVKGPDGLIDFERLWEGAPPIDDDLRSFIQGADGQLHALNALD